MSTQHHASWRLRLIKILPVTPPDSLTLRELCTSWSHTLQLPSPHHHHLAFKSAWGWEVAWGFQGMSHLSPCMALQQTFLCAERWDFYLFDFTVHQAQEPGLTLPINSRKDLDPQRCLTKLNILALIPLQGEIAWITCKDLGAPEASCQDAQIWGFKDHMQQVEV